MSITIETNNFNEVVQHFDEAGELINKKTRVAIDCYICQCKNLALVNPSLDQITDDTHEKYVVLRCGHAFGVDCLKTWIRIEGQSRAKCPSCRSPIKCQRNHTGVIFTLFGIGAAADAQAKDIQNIRGRAKECYQCTNPSSRPRRPISQPPQVQRSVAEQAQITQEVEARLGTVWPTIRAGTSLHRENIPLWNRVQNSVSRLQTQLHYRTSTGNTRGEELRIQDVYNNTSSAIRRVTQQTDQVDETTWGLVDALVTHIRSEAEERLARERRNAEITQQIETHLSAIRALMEEGAWD
ncbi:hypothetical protein F5Y08DRAFT_351775 [Xylaria arbuscula]|nr:hypothetical protein F5Y08DRAFT_351775 [Xylaria arbuscula]